MSALFFERVWLLLGLLVAAQFALIACWSRRRSRGSARIVWMGFVSIPMLATISLAVVTPRESIIVTCRELAVHIDRGDLSAVGVLLSDDFRTAELDRNEFMDRLREGLTRYKIDHPRLGHFRVDFPAQKQAVVTFSATCRVRSVDAPSRLVPSRWRIGFRQDQGLWKVVQIETVSTPHSPLWDVRRLLLR